jgi:hypothetical protein
MRLYYEKDNKNEMRYYKQLTAWGLDELKQIVTTIRGFKAWTEALYRDKQASTGYAEG